MRQDHAHLNIVRFSDYATVEFDVPEAALMLPRPSPVLSAHPADAGIVTQVPAPTDGPGRYAFRFVPGDHIGHCVVTIAIVDPDDADRAFTRSVDFIVIPDCEAVINVGACVVAPKTPEMLAAFELSAPIEAVAAEMLKPIDQLEADDAARLAAEEAVRVDAAARAAAEMEAAEQAAKRAAAEQAAAQAQTNAGERATGDQASGEGEQPAA